MVVKDGDEVMVEQALRQAAIKRNNVLEPRDDRINIKIPL
jgi:hypothetical protein